MLNKNYDLVSFADAVINDELTDPKIIEFYRHKFFPRSARKNSVVKTPARKAHSFDWVIDNDISVNTYDYRYTEVYDLLLHHDSIIRDACKCAHIGVNNFTTACVIRKVWRFKRFDGQMFEGRSIDDLRRNAAYAGVALPGNRIISDIAANGGHYESFGHYIGTIQHIGFLKKLDVEI